MFIPPLFYCLGCPGSPPTCLHCSGRDSWEETVRFVCPVRFVSPNSLNSINRPIGNPNSLIGLIFSNAACTGVEPYSKCPFSNHQSQQRIQILGYHNSVDAVIRDKIFNTQNNEFFNWKKKRIVKKYTEKEKENHPTTFLCCLRLYVAEKGVFCMVLRACTLGDDRCSV